MKSWLPGEQIAFRGIVHNCLWIAHPITVVEGTADYVAAYLVPGTLCKVTRGREQIASGSPAIVRQRFAFVRPPLAGL